MGRGLLWGAHVIPAWEGPDELGHYSYAQEMAHGRLPVLTIARTDPVATQDWVGTSATVRNAIAQHPPLHYALIAPMMALAEWVGFDVRERLHVMRAISAIFGGLALIAIGLLARDASGYRLVGVSAVLAVGALPQLLYLGSVASHEMLLLALCAWSFFFQLRAARGGRYRAMLLAAALGGLAGLTKSTALPFVVVMGAISILGLWRSSGRRIGARLIAIVLLWYGPAALWAAWNMWHFGMPFADAGLMVEIKPISISAWSLVSDFPFLQQTLRSSLGAFSLTATQMDALTWLQVDGLTVRALLWLPLLGLVAGLAPQTPSTVSTRSNIVIVAAIVCITLCSDPVLMVLPWVLLILTLVSVIATSPFVLRNGDPEQGLRLGAALAIALLLGVYFFKLWSNFEGQLRATHGRYFLSVLPALVYLMASALNERRLALCACVAAVVAVLASEQFLLHQALPFFNGA